MKQTKEEIIESIRITKPKELRLGQAIFNTFLALYPERTEQTRATELDPFHDDSRIDAFLDYVLGERK